jgi:AcrR family transcriptional regulator
MPKTGPDARERLVAAAADMLRRRGLNATSIREVAKFAQAPLGSTYHYFPDGKQQMIVEAVRFAGDAISRNLQERLAADPVNGLYSFLVDWREALLGTEFRAGCPVLAVAVEESGEDFTTAQAAAAEIFKSWATLIADALAPRLRNREKAEDLAHTVIAAVEGGIILCRAQRSIVPFDRVARTLMT